MAKNSKGFRHKTRKRLHQKSVRPTLIKFLQEFDIGQRVVIVQEPSSHKGMPFPRFKGRMGKVIGKRGKSYIVEVKDINKLKTVISRPEHLKVI